MGCGQSKPPEEEPVNDPLMQEYSAAKDYATKAKLIMLLASQEEARGKLHTAIKLHGTHLACMAAHMFKEVDRSRAEELINLAQGCRRIAAHRAMLQQKAIQEASQVCFGSPYIPSDPPAPGAILPHEWSQFLILVKGSADVQKSLEKMGLLRTKEKTVEVHHVHHQGGETVVPPPQANVINVNLPAQSPAQPSQVFNMTGGNINLAQGGSSVTSNTVSAPAPPMQMPTIHMPVTIAPNIGGATACPNVVTSTAQTGEGNISPATSGGGVGDGGGCGQAVSMQPSGSWGPSTPTMMSPQQQQQQQQQGYMQQGSPFMQQPGMAQGYMQQGSPFMQQPGYAPQSYMQPGYAPQGYMQQHPMAAQGYMPQQQPVMPQGCSMQQPLGSVQYSNSMPQPSTPAPSAPPMMATGTPNGYPPPAQAFIPPPADRSQFA